MLGCGYVLLLLWVGAWLSCVLSGNPSPPPSLLLPVQAVGHVVDPSAVWGQPVGPAWLYWSLTVVVLSLGLGLPVLAWRRLAHARGFRDVAAELVSGGGRPW